MESVGRTHSESANKRMVISNTKDQKEIMILADNSSSDEIEESFALYEFSSDDENEIEKENQIFGGRLPKCETDKKHRSDSPLLNQTQTELVDRQVTDDKVSDDSKNWRVDPGEPPDMEQIEKFLTKENIPVLDPFFEFARWNEIEPNVTKFEDSAMLKYYTWRGQQEEPFGAIHQTSDTSDEETIRSAVEQEERYDEDNDVPDLWSEDEDSDDDERDIGWEAKCAKQFRVIPGQGWVAEDNDSGFSDASHEDDMDIDQTDSDEFEM